MSSCRGQRLARVPCPRAQPPASSLSRAAQAPLDVTRMHLCVQEALIARGLIDIGESLDRTREQTGLQSMQPRQGPRGTGSAEAREKYPRTVPKAERGRVGRFPHQA